MKIISFIFISSCFHNFVCIFVFITPSSWWTIQKYMRKIVQNTSYLQISIQILYYDFIQYVHVNYYLLLIKSFITILEEYRGGYYLLHLKSNRRSFTPKNRSLTLILFSVRSHCTYFNRHWYHIDNHFDTNFILSLTALSELVCTDGVYLLCFYFDF